jgi:Tfp pilus assembly protein PilO
VSSGSAQTTPLLRRIFNEHRRVALPLAIAFAVNVVAYGAVVYPLSQRVANIEERTRAAELQLAAARQEHGRASGTVTGKDRAAKELETFYTRVLPADVAGARRLITLRMPQLAAQSDLRWQRARTEEIEDRDGTLKALRYEMSLTGSWAGLRTFIHQLETAPEFVAIDNIALAEGADGDGALQVDMQVSTYFRNAAP